MPKALIIGAAGGIGSQLCQTLAASNWHFILAGRTLEPLNELADSLPNAVAAEVDAQDFDAVDNLFAEHSSPDEPFNAAVNLAGSILIKPAHSTSFDDYQNTVDQNLRTAFALTRAAGKHMRKSGGSVVLMSSCAAAFGLPNHEAIAAAKAGVEGLARAASASYASNNLRFNVVAPGLVDTPLAARLTSNEASLKASTSMHPLARIGTPADIAAPIAMLMDPANNWITGQTIGVDGGLANVKAK